MISIVIYLLLANVFYNSGYLPNIEDRGQFLTHVARYALDEIIEPEAETLIALLQHANSDEERARAFVAWTTVTLNGYIAKIRKKEELPLMVTYNLVLNFFFDMHLYSTQTDWKSITSSFDFTVLDASDQKIFEKILIPYLQEQPTVDRLHTALKALCQERFENQEIKERMKAFFIRICLPFFVWRLKGHLEKMNRNQYVVARAEKVQGYILKRYIKEQNKILMVTARPTQNDIVQIEPS